MGEHTVVGLASRSCAERVSHSCDDSINGIVAFEFFPWTVMAYDR